MIKLRSFFFDRKIFITKINVLFKIDHKLPKIPKATLDQAKNNKFSIQNFFTNFFISKSMDALAQELFIYFTNSIELKENFPILLENKDIYTNFLCLHVYLLHRRLCKEPSIYAKQEAEKLLFLFKSTYFIKFAENLNDFLPVQDFSSFYSENYFNRYKMFEQELNNLYVQSQNAHFSKEEEDNEVKKIIRKVIFFNKFSLKHNYIKKTLSYFEAHANYLDSLTYSEIIENKIFWGFADPKLLENGENQNNLNEEKNNP